MISGNYVDRGVIIFPFSATFYQNDSPVGDLGPEEWEQIWTSLISEVLGTNDSPVYDLDPESKTSETRLALTRTEVFDFIRRAVTKGLASHF